MKTFIFILLSFIFIANVNAEPYISLQGGWSVPDKFSGEAFKYFEPGEPTPTVDGTDGLTFGGALGWDFGIPRLALDIQHVSYDLNVNVPIPGAYDPKGNQLTTRHSVSQSTTYYFVNGYLDWKVHERLELYGGGGIDLGGEGYNATIGAQYLFNENWGFDISTRYIINNDFADSNNIMFGVRYTFD